MITHFFIDMDGVLVDIQKFFDDNFPKLATSTDIQRKSFMVEKTLCENTRMFATMQPTQGFEDLKLFCNQLLSQGIKVCVLTSLGNMSRECDIYNQKKEWLVNHNLGHLGYFAVTGCDQKSWLAHNGAILLDDRIDNCESFELNGGHTVCYDQYQHQMSFDKLKTLYDQLTK